MRVFILKADKSVEVEEVPVTVADYTSACFPKNQIFVKGLNSWAPERWHCLHRDNNRWVVAEKVPSEVLLAEMIVN